MADAPGYARPHASFGTDGRTTISNYDWYRLGRLQRSRILRVDRTRRQTTRRAERRTG